MNRKIAQAGLTLIKSFEGCRLTAYNATGKEQYWTIGWGHYGPDVKKDAKITQAEADNMLASDLTKYESYVNNPTYVPITADLNQNQFDALVSFCYNCGAGNLKRLCASRTATQISASINAYNKGGGVVLAGLVKRRAAETALFNKEDDQPMTTEEKKAFDALVKKVADQDEQIKALQTANSMSVPEWAKSAMDSAVKAKIVNTPDGRSYDFYSILTALHNKGVI